ncbi:MAG: hypothetical protein ACOVP4_06000 [Bacteriovoracaceae bacterium]
MKTKSLSFILLISSILQLNAFSAEYREIVYDCNCIIGKKECLADIPESTPAEYAKLVIYLKGGNEYEWNFWNWNYRDIGEIDKNYRGEDPSYKSHVKLMENWRLGQDFRSIVYLPKKMLNGSPTGYAIYTLPEEKVTMNCIKRPPF